MEYIYKVFISATKKTMENERQSLINNLLRQGCFPVTMEYFIAPHNKSTLKICINSIDESDAVIVSFKSTYGEKIPKSDVEQAFYPLECPFKKAGCTCNTTGMCIYSYTHFEYLYACNSNKIVYVLASDDSSEDVKKLSNDTKRKGGYNIYTDMENFNAISTSIISSIIDDCKKDVSLGYVSAKSQSKTLTLIERIKTLENNYNEGIIPLKNYMGAILHDNDLIFYVYKEFELRREKSGYDFSIHINTAHNKDFDEELSKSYIQAHAYIKRINRGESFSECIIEEKSYGREYLNCHIEFVKINNKRVLTIKKDEVLGILYTYKVDKKLYGNEIGRKTSPFLEDALVELMYDTTTSRSLSVDFFEKIENKEVEVDEDDVLITDTSFLDKMPLQQDAKKCILETYGLKGIEALCVKSIRIPNGDKNRTMHFYIRWEENNDTN